MLDRVARGPPGQNLPSEFLPPLGGRHFLPRGQGSCIACIDAYPACMSRDHALFALCMVSMRMHHAHACACRMAMHAPHGVHGVHAHLSFLSMLFVHSAKKATSVMNTIGAQIARLASRMSFMMFFLVGCGGLSPPLVGLLRRLRIL